MRKIPTLYVRDPDTHYVTVAICRDYGYEGIVWHHPDGRMVNLKVRDYPNEGQR